MRNRILKDIICLFCKSGFHPKNHLIKYCSRACVDNARKGKIGNWLGRKHSEESKKKISNAKKGNIAWNRGKVFSINKKIKKILSIGRPRKMENSAWKGTNVSYRGLHLWIQNNLGKPTTCEFCHKTNLIGRQIHWANKSQEYKRDFDDWMRLCSKCHGKYDAGHRRKKRLFLERYA